MKILINIAVVLVLLLSTTGLQASEINKKIIGTWTYTANDAPESYKNGEITFYKDGKLTKAKISTQYDVITSKKVSIKDNTITLEFIVEYELCIATLKLTKDMLKGEVNTIEGTIPLTLKRKLKK